MNCASFQFIKIIVGPILITSLYNSQKLHVSLEIHLLIVKTHSKNEEHGTVTMST